MSEFKFQIAVGIRADREAVGVAIFEGEKQLAWIELLPQQADAFITDFIESRNGLKDRAPDHESVQ